MIDLLLEAERALSVGLLDRAETLYRQVATVDPRNSIAVVGLARVALDRGDDVKALELSRKAVAIDPENPAAQRMVTRLEEIIDWRGEGTATGDEPADVPSESGPEPQTGTQTIDTREAVGETTEHAAEGAVEVEAEAEADEVFQPPLEEEQHEEATAPEPTPEAAAATEAVSEDAAEAPEAPAVESEPEVEPPAAPATEPPVVPAPQIEPPASTLPPPLRAPEPSAPPTYPPAPEPRRRGFLDRLFRRSG